VREIEVLGLRDVFLPCIKERLNLAGIALLELHAMQCRMVGKPRCETRYGLLKRENIFALYVHNFVGEPLERVVLKNDFVSLVFTEEFHGQSVGERQFVPIPICRSFIEDRESASFAVPFKMHCAVDTHLTGLKLRMIGVVTSEKQGDVREMDVWIAKRDLSCAVCQW
jgi:hypothetical protein